LRGRTETIRTSDALVIAGRTLDASPVQLPSTAAFFEDIRDGDLAVTGSILARGKRKAQLCVGGIEACLKYIDVVRDFREQWLFEVLEFSIKPSVRTWK
jgi:hypothetical protein